MTRARTLLTAAVAVLLAVTLLPGTPASADPPDTPSPAADAPSPAPGVLILHTDSTADARSARLRDDLEALGAEVRHTFAGQQTVSVQLPTDGSVDAAQVAAQVAALPGVSDVERPVRRTYAGAPAVPNDSLYGRQRGYLDAISAATAWQRGHGSPVVRIAVLDSGVDVTHPDLAPKIVGRYNADDGSTDVTDHVGHGTFVAGVAAAVTNNNRGVAGAGWNSSLLAVKVADRYDDITIDDEVAGIRWAADHGADVINLSISGVASSTAERKAIEYAQGKGVLVVAAAGNDGDTTRQYPAAYPGVVAVGATDTVRRTRAGFSSHGSWVTLAAPGVGIWSTTPLKGSNYFPSAKGYGNGDGTSFASPLVAGAAALVLARNPALTPAQVRAALVASAHGYGGRGLGRGQVDLDLALRHTIPTTAPLAVVAAGTSGRIALRALSSAPRVAFRVDGSTVASAAVSGGRANAEWTSFGFANGPHTVTAVDCTEFGECNTRAATTTASVANAAPSLATPATGATVSGQFAATGQGPGGGARLLVDGREAAFDPAAPYSFTVNASRYGDREHTLAVQTCTSGHTRCAGPTSATHRVRFDSLHPAVTGLSRTRISPDGNGSGDTAVLTFTLPESQRVIVETRDSRGAVVHRSPLGVLRAGRHTYVWRGFGSGTTRLRDGAYRLVVVTSRGTGSSYREGQTERSVVVDTVAPRLVASRGAGARLFPVRDGYLDTFRPSVVVPDGGALTLTVRTASGRTVRVLGTGTRAGTRAALAWTGRTASGRVVAAGAYRWYFTVWDAAGNHRRSATHQVFVSGKRLRQRAVDLVAPGASARDIGGTARCAGRGRTTLGTSGVRLVNTCRPASNDVAFARFTFRLPVAHAYNRLGFAVLGRAERPSDVNAIFRRPDGGVELPAYVRVAPGRLAWRSIAGVYAAGHVSGRSATVSMLLGSGGAPANDIDVRSVRLRVVYTYLG